MEGPEVEPECAALLRAARALASAADDASRAAASRAVAAAAGPVSALVRRHAAAVAKKHASLARGARIDEDDVAQEVLRKLLERPPVNEADNPPIAVVVGWVRAVALRHLLDRARQKHRYLPAKTPAGDDDAPLDPPASGRLADDALAARQDVERMRAVAPEALAGHKHLPEVYAMLALDPELPAFEIAVGLGLVPPPPPPPWPADYRKKKDAAVQYAWKLRQRTLDRLAESLGEGRRAALAGGRS
ncbi:MAG: hypothetical protein JNL38_09345 [Myxococcales bacterium]|nr:hypothetical protein [Myxococcales bacterium]